MPARARGQRIHPVPGVHPSDQARQERVLLAWALDSLFRGDVDNFSRVAQLPPAHMPCTMASLATLVYLVGVGHLFNTSHSCLRPDPIRFMHALVPDALMIHGGQAHRDLLAAARRADVAQGWQDHARARQLRHHFWPFLTHFSRISQLFHPTRAGSRRMRCST